MASSEQPSKTAAPSQEHVYPPPVVAFTPQPFNGATYASPPPPGAYPPPFFAYPPPPEGNHGENGQNGVPPPGPPYMMAFPPPPPGMVYAFPSPQGQVPPGAPVPAPPALTKPKRKQVKMACTNCAAACKRCDEGRPCERCMKYGISDTCRDGQRKERKKGIKRGPYKRKGKNGDAEWVPTAQAAAANPSASMHSVAPYASPECYYGPVYYPTPGAFLPHPPHEVPPGQEGTVSTNGTPPIMPYFLPAYPPYAAPYGHPAMYPGPIQPSQQAQQPPQPPQPQAVQPQQTIQQVPNGTVEAPAVAEGSSTKKKKEEAKGAKENTTTSASGTGTTGTSKKRTRGSKGGEPKAKKAKTSRAAKEKEDGGQGDGGVQAATP